MKTTPVLDLRPTIRALADKREAARAAASSPPSPLVRQILAAIESAVKSWAAEPANAALLAGVDPADVAPLHDALARLTTGRRFAGVMRLLAAHRTLEADTDFTIESISIGVGAQADLLVGGSASMGYAFQPFDAESGRVSMVILGVSVGDDVGAEVDLQIGVWARGTDQMADTYSAENVDLDDIMGGTGYRLKADGSTQAILAGVALGIEDGGDIDGVWVETAPSGSPYALIQEPAEHMLVLTTLRCIQQNSPPGSMTDKVYLVFTPDDVSLYRHPYTDYYKMSEDQDADDHQWACGRSVYFTDTVSVSARDDDDQFAYFDFTLSDFSGPGSTKTVTYHRGGSLTDWNEVEYELTARLIF